jgi:hypothetical protein
MGELVIATLLWDSNRKSQSFSRCYDERWVERLYLGFHRNMRIPFRFVVFTDRKRDYYTSAINQEHLRSPRPDYSTCIEPYRLNEPMILCGLDTVVIEDATELGEYCLSAKVMALPRDPYRPNIACNGVALVPAGHRDVFVKHKRENDMEWVRRWPHVFIDDIFPGKVKSYKGHVEKKGIEGVSVVYFHGKKKPHELMHLDWIQRSWR